MSRPARPASTRASLCLSPCGAAPATPAIGGGHGSNHRTRRRARRASRLGGGLCHPGRGGAPGDAGDANLRRHAAGPGSPARRAARAGCHPRRHGGNRHLLATGARYPGERFHRHRRQRLAHAQRAWAQDGREGRRVDRRPAPPRAGARQLRAAAGDQGAARADPAPQGGGRQHGGGAQPHAAAARKRRHQARRRDE